MHPHNKNLTTRLNEINRIISNYKSLENYYKTSNLFFNLVINNEKPIPELEFIVNFKSKQLCYNFPKLPINIISIIASYSYSFISIETRIYFPNNYPFDPPIWRLVNVKTNINTSIDLRSYYKYIVNNHNEIYKYKKKNKYNYSPAITIDADLLYFIQRINHFEYITEDI